MGPGEYKPGKRRLRVKKLEKNHLLWLEDGGCVGENRHTPENQVEDKVWKPYEYQTEDLFCFVCIQFVMGNYLQIFEKVYTVTDQLPR